MIEDTVRQELRSVAAKPLRLARGQPPPLENGDHLTRAEFERRYWAMPGVKKAELIEGVVHMPTPVRYRSHGYPHTDIIWWLKTYCIATPGVGMADNASVRLDLENELQPDALLRLEPAAGGQSRISEDDIVEGAPELVVEIAATSSSADLHSKLRVYRRNGVKEYVVWRVLDQELDWFALGEEEPVRLEADEAGVICSQAFPGLCLAVRALLQGDLNAVLSEVQKGLQTPEHAAFVKRLGEAAKEPHNA